MGNTPGTKRSVATQGLTAICLAIACGVVSIAVAAQAAPLKLQIGSAQGLAGQTVSVDVTIQNLQAAAGVQNDIVFTAAAPIAATPFNQPVCAFNSMIPPGSFGFQPFGCVPGITCTAVREVVLTFPSLPLSDGDVLYTCKVAISPTAGDGVYPLHGTNVFASDQFGGSIPAQILDGNVTVGPTIHDAPASLILRSARLQASPGIRLGRGLGSADLDAAVDTNAPFGGLIDDIQAGGLTLNLATDGAAFALGWTAGQCRFQPTPHGPSIRCDADDFTSHRIVTLHPTRLPNVLAMKLRTRHLNLRPPLTTAPVEVSLVTATFRRPDDIGDCVVMGKDQERKICREVGVQPSATPTASATGTVTQTGTATGTGTWTPTITRTPTPTWTRTPNHTPTNAGTPTATRTSTPIVVPTGPLGERSFSIDEPGALFAGTTAARSGLFTSYLNGENVADEFSSGPLVLVGGVPDAQGVASLTLKSDVTLTLAIYDGSWACIQLFAAGSTGSIDCDGGTAYDVEGSQPTGDVGTSFTVDSGLGAPAAPGNGMLLVTGQGQPVPPGPMPDCSTITYTNPPQLFPFTTTIATALKGTTQLAVAGEPFACTEFATPGTGGMLVTPAPAYQAPYGDLANVFRYAEVPTGKTRVFTIDSLLSQFVTADSPGSGLFNDNLLGGGNVAATMSSGPLTLVLGTPDANGIAPLSLQDDVVISIDVSLNSSCVCLKFFAAGSTGSIDCDGGTAFDTTVTQTTNSVSATSWTIQTGQGMPAGPGNGDLVINGLFQDFPGACGTDVDCATANYTNAANQFPFTTTQSTADKTVLNHPYTTSAGGSGQAAPFDCANFGTPGSGGALVSGITFTDPIGGPTADALRFSE